jgi:hypothetical protein
MVNLIKQKEGIFVACRQLLVEEYSVTARLNRRDVQSPACRYYQGIGLPQDAMMGYIFILCLMQAPL